MVSNNDKLDIEKYIKGTNTRNIIIDKITLLTNEITLLTDQINLMNVEIKMVDNNKLEQMIRLRRIKRMERKIFVTHLLKKIK